jgi:hypothetical protein
MACVLLGEMEKLQYLLMIRMMLKVMVVAIQVEIAMYVEIFGPLSLP